MKWAIFFALSSFSIHVMAFEFSNTASRYDFTQTFQINVIDPNNAKFFAMYDPFEIKVTTVPSRFYVAVLGVLERGRRNMDVIAVEKELVTGQVFTVIFRSLDSAYVFQVGSHWILDDGKMILMAPEEITVIFKLLANMADGSLPMDLEKLSGLFLEIEQQITASQAVGATEELASMKEAVESILERLPAGHNDVENLPYYNKWMDNQEAQKAPLAGSSTIIKTSPRRESATESILTTKQKHMSENEYTYSHVEFTPAKFDVAASKPYVPALFAVLVVTLMSGWIWCLRRSRWQSASR